MDHITSISIQLENSQTLVKLKELNYEIIKTQKSLIDLTKAKKGNSDAFRKGEKILKKQQEQQQALRKSMDPTKMSLKDLKKYRTLLREEMNKELPDSTQFQVLQREIAEVNTQYKKLSNESVATKASLSSVYETLRNNVQMIGAGYYVFSSLVRKLHDVTDAAVALTDTFADVRKTTGLTQEEIVDLDKALMEMDTRTSREGLLNLARDAGKLGITGTENIRQFVSAADKINVALGEDLGEGAIRNIGKMADVFGITQELGIENSYLKIGAAINELGQSSTASESYLVDFTQRLSGVAAQSGISIQNILGYASALDQSGQAVEMSATAMQKFIMKLYEEPQKFAKLAGKDVTEFKDLLMNDANQAIMSVLRSLNESGGFSQLVPVFQQMGLDGARAVGVLSSLATNLDAVSTAQAISNEAFTEGTSAINEYNVQNVTAAARVDKYKKKLQEARVELGQKLMPVLFLVQNTWMFLIKVLGVLSKFLFDHWKSIAALAAVYGVLQFAVNATIVWQKLLNRLQTAGTVIVVAAKIAWDLLGVAINLANGKISDAIIAWKTLSKTFSANAIGLVITGIIALGSALLGLIKRSNNSKNELKKFGDELDRISDIRKKAAESTAKERVELDLLFEKLKKTNPKSQERLDLIDKINSKYGTSLQNIQDENKFLEQLNTTYGKLNKSIQESAMIEARKSSLAELYAQKDNLTIEMKDEVKKEDDKAVKSRNKLGRKASQDDIDTARQKEFQAAVETGGITLDELDAYERRRLEQLEKKTKQFEKIQLVDKKIQSLLQLANPGVASSKSEPEYSNTPIQSQELNESDKKNSSRVEFNPNEYQKLYEQQRETLIASARKLQLDILNENEREIELIHDKYAKEFQVIDESTREMERKAQEYKKQLAEGSITKKDYDEFLETKKLFDQTITDRSLQVGAMEFTDVENAKLAQVQKSEESIYQLRLKYKLLTDSDVYEHDLKLLQDKLDKQLISIEAYEIEKKQIEDTYAQKPIEAAEIQKKEDFQKKYSSDKEDLSTKKTEELAQLDKDAELAGVEDYEAQKAAIEEKYRVLQDEADKAALEKKLQRMSENVQAFQSLIGNIGGIVSNLKDRELMQSEAQFDKEKESYDKMLRNKQISQKTYDKKMMALEEKKKEEEKEIQKKYADQEFAVKVASIIAQTALAAMQAFSSMAAIPGAGPALGIIAAATATAFGATQIAIAKAEHEKVKGFEVGGYTGDGQADDVAGVVHKGEYVIPKWQMRERRTINYVQSLEAIRVGKKGYKSGGSVEVTPPAPEENNTQSPQNLSDIIEILRRILSNLQGVDIVYLKKQLDVIEEKEQLMEERFGVR